MNLKRLLLIRMTLMGLLCWLGVSVYLVGQSARREAEDITTVANQLQPMVASDVMRRWASLDSDARQPDLGGAAARFPEPMCLRYSALDGTYSDWGCGPSAVDSGVPHWIASILGELGPRHISLQRPIAVYGLAVGTLHVESDDASLLRHQWRSVRDLLGLAAVMLLALDLLAFWVVGRALRPTARIVAAVEQLGEGMNDVRLPPLRPREFRLIASGINRLAQRLADSYAARAELTARLIRVQEDERRELAHELHEEFGQCVTALSAVSASLRHSVSQGDVLTEADVLPLETGIEQMLSSLRGMLQALSVPPLEQQGLRSAVADLVAAWQIRLQAGPRVVIDADPAADQMPNHEYAPCIYRVVQECLNNIARHAPDSVSACVCIRQQSHWLQVRVSNDLVGVKQNRAGTGTGMGLKLLAERVRALHGVFSVEMSAVQFAVQASLPMNTP
ncbi:MAG TPA: HAMP domain-containing protein [Steroidobacteraceae bacterium]|jgi:signal transduction histidine kinase|nr:HAMP domain-containing protein [Steroidobacteraceae bacterium]